jgi:hypothetical protein
MCKGVSISSLSFSFVAVRRDILSLDSSRNVYDCSRHGYLSSTATVLRERVFPVTLDAVSHRSDAGKSIAHLWS